MLLLLFSFLFDVEELNFGKVNTAWVAELDEDTLPDIVLGKDDGLYIYQGKNNFETHIKVTDKKIVALCIKDINRDEKPDIIISDAQKVWIYLNRNNFSYDAFSIFSQPAKMIGSIDINLDKKPDLIILYPLYTKIYLNDGKLNFSLIDSLEKARNFISLDINNDEYPDIILGGEDGIKIYTNLNGKEFIKSFESTGYEVYGISATDFNKDSLIDVVIADSSGNSFILVNNKTNWSIENKFSYEPAAIGVFSRDFNLDGKEDVILIKNGEADVVYLNQEGDWLREEITTFSTNTRICLVFDFDGDGDYDILALGNENFLYRNTTNPSNFIKIRLKGREGSFSDIEAGGVKIFVLKNKNIIATSQVTQPEGFSSSSSYHFIFKNDGNLTLFLNWPQTGIRDTFYIKSPSPLSLFLEEDILPPQPPESVRCLTHEKNEWSNKNPLEFLWRNSKDPYGSGVLGYSILLDSSPTSIPDTLIDVFFPDSFYQVYAEFEGLSYFHIISFDSVKNQSSSITQGPYKLDFSSPSVFNLKHPPDSFRTNQKLIDFSWETAQDLVSGIKNYTLQLSKDPYFIEVERETLVVDTFINNFFIPSPGEKFWKVTAQDSAGNSRSSKTRRLIIDLTPPKVSFTNPKDGDQGVSPQVPIWIKFTEKMDTSSFNENITIRGEKSGTHSFIFKEIEEAWYEFEMETPFQSFENVFCTVKKSLKDLAGNPLGEDYDFSFKTGALDILGPKVENTEIQPNPCGAEIPITVTSTASDVETGNSTVTHMICFFDDTLKTDTIWLPLKDGIPDKSTEIFEGKILSPSKRGTHILFLKARDLPGNWGAFSPETVYVSPLNLSLSINKDTLEIGDSLIIKVISSERLKECLLTISQKEKVLKKCVLTSPDSIIFKDTILTEGFPFGIVNLKITGEALDGLKTYVLKTVYIKESSQLIDRKNTFAYPNPTKGILKIKIVTKENVYAIIKLTTIEGIPIKEPIKKVIKGGKIYEERVDVSKFPLGVYLYQIEVTGEYSKRKDKFIGKFAIVK